MGWISVSASIWGTPPWARSGSPGRTDYGAIGTVVHLAARLCDAAKGGEILISQRVQLATDVLVATVRHGERIFPGAVKAVDVYAVERLRSDGNRASSGPEHGVPAGPLTEREREVVELIVRGYTNRQIATELVIAETTAVRHVANILNKLDLKSRAQVAVWAVEREHAARDAAR